MENLSEKRVIGMELTSAHLRYLLVRPNKYVGDNEVKIDISKI